MHACFPNFGTVDEKFGLPKHGPLRITKGEEMFYQKEKNLDSIVFNSDAIFGNICMPCKIVIDVMVHRNGFSYGLLAKLLDKVDHDIRINPGLHPYFSTSLGKAVVRFNGGKKIIWVTETTFGPAFFPNLQKDNHDYKNCEIIIDIEGLGTVTMIPSGLFGPEAKIVIWRDSPNYLCVEPILAPGEFYWTESCPRIEGGIRTDCSFFFRPYDY